MKQATIEQTQKVLDGAHKISHGYGAYGHQEARGGQWRTTNVSEADRYMVGALEARGLSLELMVQFYDSSPGRYAMDSIFYFLNPTHKQPQRKTEKDVDDGIVGWLDIDDIDCRCLEE